MLQQLIEAAREAERVGAWDEALMRYEAAFTRLPAEGDAPTATSILCWIGRVHRERGDLELAEELYEASLAVAELNGLDTEVARALIGLAAVEQFRGEIDLAQELYTRAGGIAGAVGEAGTVAVVEQNLGILANIRGEIPEALSHYHAALEGFRELGRERGASQVLNCMGMAHVDLARWTEAERCFDEGFALARKAGDAYMTGAIEINRTELYLQRERFEHARESCDRAAQVFGELKSKSWMAEAYKLYGMLYRETGKPAQADTHFALALGLAEASQNRLLEAESQLEWALLRLEEAREQDAILYLNRALGIFTRLRARREVTDIERRLERLEATYLPVVRAWGAEPVEAKDRYKVGCTQRVAEYGAMLGGEAGLSGSELTWLRVGAFVHEVGNGAVPAGVLEKPGALTAPERELVQVHTVVGHSIVSQLSFPEEVRHMVRSHHERWDGAGYPDRLRGEGIPLHARILSVASVYDALTTPRAYRPSLSRQDAAGVLRREAGGALDPELVGLFCARV